MHSKFLSIEAVVFLQRFHLNLQSSLTLTRSRLSRLHPSCVVRLRVLLTQAGDSMVVHFRRRQSHEGTSNATANLSWQFTLTALKFKFLALF